ncbi:unnamed protein product [Paramecium sonneborni]|uniref:Uncharacterized protein n=1 Tax=Paramecium sonneborni TaxID=65129 RepID=A0A8S1R7V1_9CILI|nr:unnamed protein product [Paramecium sonneborni]
MMNKLLIKPSLLIQQELLENYKMYIIIVRYAIKALDQKILLFLAKNVKQLFIKNVMAQKMHLTIGFVMFVQILVIKGNF